MSKETEFNWITDCIAKTTKSLQGSEKTIYDGIMANRAKLLQEFKEHVGCLPSQAEIVFCRVQTKRGPKWSFQMRPRKGL